VWSQDRGKDHLDALARVPNVEIAALCDIDDAVLNKRRGEVGGSPRTFVDVRRLLEDQSIDAISIATPNHWHALMAIWACQAGKDVYVEKPCSHNLWEGRQLVRGGREVRPHRATRYAEPLGAGARRGDPSSARRHLRRDLSGARAVLQAARHDWPDDCRTRSRGGRL